MSGLPDLNKVLAFVRVIEHGSFTRAAVALGVPKSTVSRAVSDLEERLKVQLLQRTTRRTQPTDAGRRLHARAAGALAELEHATAEVTDLGSAPKGLVRLTAPHDLGVELLPTLFAEFAELHPEIEIECLLTNRTVDLVAEGVDLAIRAGPLADSTLVARKVAGGELGLYASPRYVARRGVPARPEELADHAGVLFRPRAGSVEIVLTGPGGRVVRATMRGRLGADDLLFVHRAVLAHQGIGLVPSAFAGQHLKSRALVRVLPGWSLHGAQLSLVVPGQRHVPKRVQVLRAFLAEELSRRW